MNLGLNGRRALVMGASKGLGFGIARALVAEGARVAISSRSAERIAAAAAGIGAVGLVHDTADIEGSAALIERASGALGGTIDILVINTGGPRASTDLFSFTREEWESAHVDLLLAPIELMKAVIPAMQEQGFGRILSISGSTVREPNPHLLVSTAERSGMLGVMKTFARRYGGDGITFNSLLPGIIATDRIVDLYGSQEAAAEVNAPKIAVGRLGTVEEFAGPAVFLCSEAASYITGVALLVDGGATSLV